MSEPVCRLGVTQAELDEVLGDRLSAFDRWMSGQTIALCTGERYDHEAKRYEPSGCGPHGPVVYRWDLERFLAGQPIID